MSIKNQHSIRTLYLSNSILVKVFYLIQTCLVICLAIICRFNNPIVREGSFRILIYKVISTLNNKEQRDTPIFAINCYNYYYLFLITQLNYLTLTILISISNNYFRVDLVYYKASLIKVIKIYIYYIIFYLYILYQLELYTN